MKVLQVGMYPEVRVLEVATPEPGPGEVLLRVEAVTTCPQWDLHLRHDEPMFPGHPFAYPYTPGQPGHEATGTIAALGAGVTDLAVGDRVSAWRDPGHGQQGCYAQYVLLKSADVIRVPADLPFPATAPVELAMCVGASFLVLKEMNVLRGRRIGVTGLGPAGLIAAQMARAEGAAEVIGFDPTPQRREHAASFCVDSAHDPRSDLSETFPARHMASALDGFIDCVGAKASVEFAMDHARYFVALFGVPREDYTFTPRHFMHLRLCGFPGHSREAAEYAVSLLRAGKLDLMPLVSRCLPLERYAEGIDLLERQEAIKICFLPWSEG